MDLDPIQRAIDQQLAGMRRSLHQLQVEPGDRVTTFHDGHGRRGQQVQRAEVLSDLGGGVAVIRTVDGALALRCRMGGAVTLLPITGPDRIRTTQLSTMLAYLESYEHAVPGAVYDHG